MDIPTLNGDFPCFSVPAKLMVVREHGRKGSYRQGILQTPIGEFVVFGDCLDELACGQYEGFFNIAQLVPCFRRENGKNKPAIRALLLDYRLGKRAMEAQKHPWFATWIVDDDNDDGEPGFMTQCAAGFARFASGFMEGMQASRKQSPRSSGRKYVRH